tara:strand:+ start:127 stop:270 length:144 start_codon:yes stop_codon:yes gene_type:complete
MSVVAFSYAAQWGDDAAVLYNAAILFSITLSATEWSAIYYFKHELDY